MTTVTLYSRDGCHLCDEARVAILGLRGEGLRFGFEEVDIEGDDALLSSLMERIPVVEVDGEHVTELIIDLDALRSRIDTVCA